VNCSATVMAMMDAADNDRQNKTDNGEKKILN
jgi:hypothetical protein